MRTRSSSNLPVESPPNPSTSNPKRRNRRHSKHPFILEESPVDTMADQRTMAELLHAPTEGYAEAIVVPSILAEQFELKHTVVNYNLGNSGYRPPGVANQIRPPGFAQPNVRNNQNRFGLPQGYNRGSGSLLSNTIANPKGELKAIITRSGIVLNGPFVPIPPPFVNPKEDERVEETLTDQDLAEYTIKVPPPLQEKDEVQIHKFWQMFKQLHINITLADALILIPKYHKMLKALLSYKEKLLELANTPLNENCSAVILKKLPEKLGDPGKFIIPCGFSELKYKALADLANFFIVDYKSDPRVPLILGRPFLRTARALIDVHGEEMILRKESINLINVFNDSSEDFLENLFSTNHQSGNPTFSSHLELTSPKVKDDVFDPKGGNVLPKKLLDFDSTKDLHLPYHVSATSSFSSNQLLEEFVDELAFITYPQGNDDLSFDIESNLKEIEYLLYHDPIKDIDSILKDLIDQSKLADLNDNLVDIMPEMFTDEHALDYSSPPLYDEYDDDLFKVESDTEYVYDDPFDSKGEKIKESKLLINELDLPSDFFLSFEYDSFLSEDFFKVDALPPTTRTRYLIQDFDPPLYELSFFKEVPRTISSRL
nr:hypothetical protein [Tanacetum cinerariifolium]